MKTWIATLLSLLTCFGCTQTVPEAKLNIQNPPAPPPVLVGGIDPAKFTNPVPNPYWPLVVGTTKTYKNPDEVITVEVTGDTKQIAGITAIVVRDTVRDNETNDIIEDTYDWYAQDNDGNVWYLGEDTKEYEDGEVVSTEGSWEAGVDGAVAGIVMHTKSNWINYLGGKTYQQEFYKDHAEDRATIKSRNVSVTADGKTYNGCVEIYETTPLDANAKEYKYYCENIGLVLEKNLTTGESTELVAE